MRENRPYGSEGGESGSTGLPYPYRLGSGWLRLGSGWLRLGSGLGFRAAAAASTRLP
jgi:hypothetical protein